MPPHSMKLWQPRRTEIAGTARAAGTVAAAGEVMVPTLLESERAADDIAAARRRAARGGGGGLAAADGSGSGVGFARRPGGYLIPS